MTFGSSTFGYSKVTVPPEGRLLPISATMVVVTRGLIPGICRIQDTPRSEAAFLSRS
jgi:hypothetical protein